MHMLAFRATRALVRTMLEDWGRYTWTLQGFGMLRAYVSKELRLHVWSSDQRTENVSSLHDHPWDFESLVVSGTMSNTRYRATTPSSPGASRWLCSCGPNPCSMPSEPEPVWLKPEAVEHVHTGELYNQTRLEVHESQFADGTVSLISRRFYDDTEHARVFYRDRWVTAEPRAATSEEIRAIIGKALARWDLYAQGRNVCGTRGEWPVK